jgi:hypothetical protein
MSPIGRAGPSLSARLCASLQTSGDRSLFLLASYGLLKGRTETVVRVDVQGCLPIWEAADLSKTAGAEAFGPMLNPLISQSLGPA